MVKAVQKVKFRFWELLELLQSSPMPLHDQLKELEEIKKLVDDKKISISGWSEEKYQDFHTVMLKKLEDREKESDTK